MEILLYGKPIDRTLLKNALLRGLADEIRAKKDRSKEMFLYSMNQLETALQQRRHKLHQDDDEFVEYLGATAEAAKRMRLQLVAAEAEYRDWENGKTLRIVEEKVPE